MSETEHDVTDILLPSAKIGVFTADSETLNSVNEIKADWRFARVDIQVHEGGAAQAVETYKQQASPDMLIIQTEDIDEGFTNKLGELSEYCNEGTAAIIIGPVNDVNLYRDLIDMGVSDYLVRPVGTEGLSDAVARTLIERLGVSASRLIAFLGAKGGVGTTSLAQLCAYGISEGLSQKTTLIDAAGGWSSLGVGMGFDPMTTLASVSRAIEAREEESLNRMFHTSSEKLNILAGGGEPMLNAPLDSEKYEHVLDAFMAKAPVLLVDLSGADTMLKKVVLSRANQIVLVSTPTLTSLRSARSVTKEIAAMRGGAIDDVSLVINMQGVSKAHEVSPADIEVAMDCKPAAIIPFLPGTFIGHESEMRQVLNDKDGKEVLYNSLLPVLKRTVSSEVVAESQAENDKKSGLLGGFLTKITSK